MSGKPKPKPTKPQIEGCKARWHLSPQIPGFWCRRIIHPDRPTGFTAAGPQPEYALVEVVGDEQCQSHAKESAQVERDTKQKVAWRLVER